MASKTIAAPTFLPDERTIIDGTIGTRSLSTVQVKDFFHSGHVDRVIIVSPNKPPMILTKEQYLQKGGK